LHNQEVGVVDVQLDRLEQVLHCLLLRAMAIDQIFGGTAQHNLACHTNCGILLEPDRRPLLVSVVEDDGDARFSDAGLAALVD
jgi:hypothetical protein